MSRAKLYKHGDKMLTVKEIALLKYPIASIITVRSLLNRGLSVQDVIEYDVIKSEQLNRRKGQIASRKVNEEMR